MHPDARGKSVRPGAGWKYAGQVHPGRQRGAEEGKASLEKPPSKAEPFQSDHRTPGLRKVRHAGRSFNSQPPCLTVRHKLFYDAAVEINLKYSLIYLFFIKWVLFSVK